MEWKYLTYGYGPDPSPLEQLEAIKNDAEGRGSIPSAALVDVIACVSGLYAEVENLRGQVESETAKLRALVEAQNETIKVIAGYRSKRDIKTVTIDEAQLPGGDVIEVPAGPPRKKGRRRQ